MKRDRKSNIEYGQFLDRSSSGISDIFFEIKEMAKALDKELIEQINKSMLSLKKKGKGKVRGVIWLEPGVNSLKIYFAKGKYNSNVLEIFPDGWGGYPYIKITQQNYDINEVQKLATFALKIVTTVA